MIKIKNTEVLGWEHAIRGMRNPMNSWDKSDSLFLSIDRDMYDICGNHAPFYGDDNGNDSYIGHNDYTLMMKLCKAGADHRKFMRMITVYMDITAPLYWWKEFDTYKVGTVANSCSTMHKIHEKEFEESDFSIEHLFDLESEEMESLIIFGKEHTSTWIFNQTIKYLNFYRDKYIETKSKPIKNENARKELLKKYWWKMIQLLPSSYNQKRTVMLNYEVLANIYKSRKNHKLDEWLGFCDWIKTLPYSELITKEN